MQGMSELCKRCVWKHQCGQSEPCAHFEPVDMEWWEEKERVEELKQRHRWATNDTIEQGNFNDKE